MISISDQRIDQIGSTYCDFIDEIIARDEILINALAQNRLSEPPIRPGMNEVVTSELCILQLRMMCELIALLCLLAHGDIDATKNTRLQKTYKADAIINALERLHPDFFPVPSSQKLNPKTGLYNNVPLTTGFLTKNDLIKIYHGCGDKLHRGSLKKISDGSHMLAARTDLKSTSDKIWNLLEHHHIQLINPEYRIVGLAKDSALKRAQFSFWKKRDDGVWNFVRQFRGNL